MIGGETSVQQNAKMYIVTQLMDIGGTFLYISPYKGEQLVSNTQGNENTMSSTVPGPYLL